MRVPVEWLKEHVDIRVSIDELADRLTMAGLEVEAIEHVPPAEVKKQGGEGRGVEDQVLVTTVTPNRGDWLSIIGTAREVAAVLGEARVRKDPGGEGTGPPASDFIKIDILDPDLCRRYVGMLIRAVKIKDSPGWMRDRLIRAGMRPINNVVDITNYVMLEYGQPLHAFDYELLRGQRIVVRRAREGERIVSIDGVERELGRDMLVIADSERAVAIAGVMGGAESEVSARTRDILLESANFDPVSIRRTSKSLGMVTESSYRFERVVDPGITAVAARRAAQLMADLAGGEIASGMVDVYPRPIIEQAIRVRPDRVNQVLGVQLSVGKMAQYLRQLEIPVKMDGELVVTVPTFRPDITIEADVAEEIGRMHGYENIGMTLPAGPMQGADSPMGAFAERVRQIAMACGAQEVVTHSLVDPTTVELAGMSEKAVRIRNPLSEDTSCARTMLAPNLLQVIARNQAYGERDISVFEIGRVFFKEANGEPGESDALAMAMVGSLWAGAWRAEAQRLEADFYLCKGALESLLARLAVENVAFEPGTHPLLHPARVAKVSVNGMEVGIVGEVAPEVLRRLDIRGRPCVFEIDLNALRPHVPERREYRPVSRFPSLRRDLSIVVKKEVPYSLIETTARAVGADLLESIELRDVYTGPQVGPDERSITISLEFRSHVRTLTDEEVNNTLERLKSELVARFGAAFRT